MFIRRVFPNVVALMGCTLSTQQTDLLTRHFADIVLLLDGDEAGELASVKIADRLSGLVKIRCGRVPIGRQRDQLSAEELRRIIEDAVRDA
jgi:DNA primase